MIVSVKSEPGKEPSEWKVVPYADVDANEKFQVRFINLSKLLDSTTWSMEQSKAIKGAFWSMVLDGFTPAFLHLRNAITMSADPKTPILHRQAEFDSFYSKLWTAYEHRFTDVVKEMGYKLSFLFVDNEDRFLKQSTTFAEQNGISKVVMDHLAEQRQSWQKKLADIRSKVVIHAQIPAEAVPVIYETATAQTYFDNCWQTAEWFIAILIDKQLSGVFELAELPPELTEGGRRVFAIQLKHGFNPTIDTP